MRNLHLWSLSLDYKEITSKVNALINYCNLAYAYLWYSWIIICAQYWILVMNLFNSLVLVCGKSILYTMVVIKLPSLPVSNLHSHIYIFDCFFFWLLQLVLTWHCKNWKLSTLPGQFLVLPPLYLVLICVMNSSASPVIFRDPPGLALASFLNVVHFPTSWAFHYMLGILTAYVHSHIIYSIHECLFSLVFHVKCQAWS